MIAITRRIAERPQGHVSLETPAGSLVLGVIAVLGHGQRRAELTGHIRHE